MTRKEQTHTLPASSAGSIFTRIFAALATILLLWAGLPGGGGFWPLLLIACVPLLVGVSKGSRRQTVFLGLLTGLVHFLLQLYWIVFVLGHYGGLPLFLSVPALLLLSLYMAGYVVLFSIFARESLLHLPTSSSLWLLPCGWVGLDFLRSFLFSGFPWMDLGYGMAEVPLLFQSADIWGHYGLTFLIILLNSFFSLVIINRFNRKVALRLALPVCLLLLLTGSYSGWRWQQMEEQLGEAESMDVAVVQGNVDQAQKWNPARQGITVLGYIEKSRQVMRRKPEPELLVWPETALPFYPAGHPLLAPIVNFVRDAEVMLLTGSPWYTIVSRQPEDINFFNSSLLFDTRGNIVARTSKSHLVPFGEYVPLKNLLPFLAPLIEAVGDYIPGEIENPPACKKAQIGVLICLESIFPDISRKWVDAGANLLVNMTNDAWYGRSSAPYQTLAMTRLRAVETRRTIVRSANTGFSAFIDPMGRLQGLSPLFVSWAAVENVQLMSNRTFFVRGGYLFAPGCAALAFAGFVVIVRRRRSERKTVKANNFKR
jgi:apolipoprotein N-acyltransferase